MSNDVTFNVISQPKPTFSKKFYPFVVLGFSFLFLIYKYILQVSPSVMTNQLMREFHLSGELLGNLAATYFYCYLVTQLFVGILLDKYSLRKLTAMAIVICSIGAYWFGLSHTLLSAEAARCLMGVGVAFATVSFLKTAAIWFKPEHFAFISGMVASAAMIGAMVGQAPLATLTSHLGWRQTMGICSLVGFCLAAAYILIVREKPTHSPNEVPSEKIKVGWIEIRTVFTNKQNWLLTFYNGLTFAPIAVFAGLWGNPFLQLSQHITQTHAANLISLTFLGVAIGSPVAGLLTEFWLKRRTVMILGNCLGLLALVPIIYMHLGEVPMAILLFLLGFSLGAFILVFSIAKDLNGLALAATVIAIINTGEAIISAVSEPIVGKLLDHGWTGLYHNGGKFFSIHDYHLSLSILPGYILCALILLLFIRD